MSNVEKSTPHRRPPNPKIQKIIQNARIAAEINGDGDDYTTIVFAPDVIKPYNHNRRQPMTLKQLIHQLQLHQRDFGDIEVRAEFPGEDREINGVHSGAVGEASPKMVCFIRAFVPRQ